LIAIVTIVFWICYKGFHPLFLSEAILEKYSIKNTLFTVRYIKFNKKSLGHKKKRKYTGNKIPRGRIS